MPERKRFLLRIDPKLYATLEKWAADELRSVNAQIEYLLSEAAKKAGRTPRAGVDPEPERAAEGGGSRRAADDG